MVSIFFAIRWIGGGGGNSTVVFRAGVFLIGSGGWISITVLCAGIASVMITVSGGGDGV